MSKGFKDIPVRFFIWDAKADEGEGDIVECDERQFIDAVGAIDYERHTTYENGVNQICLTKNTF